MSDNKSEIFSKFIPNVKVSTRLDADGNEIDVEIREDSEAERHRSLIFDLFLSSGYFRVMMKTLSEFDKLVGGFAWAISNLDFDVDIDLLFHENLTIGSKIALVERVVAVLPKMKCPFVLEPHQIQGLDFINIYPVVQWLVMESVTLRNEKAKRLEQFAIGQFHNHFKLSSNERTRTERLEVLESIKSIEQLYALKRKFRRKHNAEPEEEMSRVRLTLLEYGISSSSKCMSNVGGNSTRSLKDISEEMEHHDEDVLDQLLIDNLAILKDETYQNADLTEEKRQEITKHYENLKMELMTDSRELSEQNKLKQLEATESALEKRLQRILEENKILSEDVRQNCNIHDNLKKESFVITEEMNRLELQEQGTDESVKTEIKNLIKQNEQLKHDETAFKDMCTMIIEELHKKIVDAENVASMPDDDQTELDEIIGHENEALRVSRLQLAKKNRSVISLQRQVDNIPDHTELAQYQKRFLELYNNMSLKHKETKQFYALYNTLNDTHLFLEKELTLLNSVYDNYNQAMTTVQSKESFLKKFEEIVDGIANSKTKIRRKTEDEKQKRDLFSSELQSFTELQRKYAATIKQFKLACEKC